MFNLGCDLLNVSKEVLFRNIKALCDKEGISIYQLEKKVGFSQHTIENSHTKAVAWERIYIVSKYFGVSMDYLIGNTNNPYSHQYPLDQSLIELVGTAEKLLLSEQDLKIIIQIMEILNQAHN